MSLPKIVRKSKSKEIQTSDQRRLTAVEFQGLSEVPPEIEWFANIDNAKTKQKGFYERVNSA